MDRELKWSNLSGVEPRAYTCGYCGHEVGPNQGYFVNHKLYRLYICTYCSRPTFFEPEGDQFPGVAYGLEVNFLPDEVEGLYNEARRTMSVNAFTAAVMACRKVLMNVAVQEGAKAGESFAFYVDWLAEQGYVPTKGRDWVDRIREKGNEANHEIPAIDRTDAEDVLSFTEMLLKVNYEMPAKAAPPEDTGT
jgi:hypothetical protein